MSQEIHDLNPPPVSRLVSDDKLFFGEVGHSPFGIKVHVIGQDFGAQLGGPIL